VLQEREVVPVGGTRTIKIDLEAPASRPPAATDELREPEALRRHLVALLEQHQGKVSLVARDMGKSRMQIHRWMQRFGINPKDYRA
jgi:transcriptional regulator of acetoin/glycerol metabolism